MNLQETNHLIAEIGRELRAKRDGSGRNLIARCPICGKEDKFGVYTGAKNGNKKPFMSHCFSCGYSTKTLDRLLALINREDLRITPVAHIETGLDINALLPPSMDVEIDDSLSVIPLPQHYRRYFSHEYLKKRGFTFDDYEYFPVGTTGGQNLRYNDYVLFPVLDEGDTVGYVARHILSKEEIDSHNRKAKASGTFKILRFRNSVENDFVKLLYNYDAVWKNETDTVIIVEGIFDVVALTRKLDLYDNRQTASSLLSERKSPSYRLTNSSQKA
jgi:DNA primase